MMNNMSPVLTGANTAVYSWLPSFISCTNMYGICCGHVTFPNFTSWHGPNECSDWTTVDFEIQITTKFMRKTAVFLTRIQRGPWNGAALIIYSLFKGSSPEMGHSFKKVRLVFQIFLTVKQIPWKDQNQYVNTSLNIFNLLHSVTLSPKPIGSY